MGLRSNIIPLEEQLWVVDSLLRAAGRTSEDREQAVIIGTLKAVHASITARLDRPRSMPLGDLERAMRQAVERKGRGNYEPRDLAAIAHAAIRHWPHIREALEWYGEETAE